jgi:hypothetical protein
LPSDDDGCRISARSRSGVPWVLLIPLAVLACRRSRPW